MIIVNCKSFSFAKDRTIYCHKNDYISSVEFFNNEYDEVLIKEIRKHNIACFNLKNEFHNPIGPAYQEYNKDGKIVFENYWINGESVPKFRKQ